METDNAHITIVVDNQAGPGLVAEHGLALLIKTGKQQILFDTGLGGALPINMNALKIDPKAVDIVVLSHGHYDHTGGLPWIFNNAGPVDLYCHPGVTKPRYSMRSDGLWPIQMPRDTMQAMDKIDEHSMHWVIEPVKLDRSVHLTGPIPRLTPFEDVGGSFYLDSEGRRPDIVEDDLAMWITTDKGIVVCVGCCHAGIVNTLNHIRELSGGLNIAAVIGGFHLLNADEERMKHTIEELKRLAPDIVVPCHCTGSLAMERLQQELGQNMEIGVSGRSYSF